MTSTISAPPGSPHSCAAARNETAFAPELARHAASSCWCQVCGEPATRYTRLVHPLESARREPVLDLASRAELQQLIAGDDVVLPPGELEQSPVEVDLAAVRASRVVRRVDVNVGGSIHAAEPAPPLRHSPMRR